MARSYKIGFEAKRLFFNFRGLGSYGRTLVSGLARYFPENDYLLYTPPFKDERSLQFEKTFSQESAKIQVKTPQSFLGKLIPEFWRSRTVVGDLENDQIDLFHGLSHELPNGIEKNKRLKKIVTIHDLIFLRFPEYYPWIDRIVYKRKFAHACRVADRIITICEFTKNDLIEYLKVPADKITVHYQSCNPRFYIKVTDEAKNDVRKKWNLPHKFILFVGAFEERKNCKGLIDAFKNIKNRDMHLVLVGFGNLKSELEARVESPGLSGRVHFRDTIGNDDIPAIYQMAEIFCFPSFFEGFGIPIVEALSSGTPVITSEGSCFPESGGNAALYINPYKVEELTNAIDLILGDENLKKSMIAKGYVQAEKFKIEQTTKNLMAIYQSLL